MTKIEMAKLMLQNAANTEQRQAAIVSAMDAGMTLQEIELYFDWLDAVHGPLDDSGEEESSLESNE